MSQLNLYVEVLTPRTSNVTLFGNRVGADVIGQNEVALE